MTLPAELTFLLDDARTTARRIDLEQRTLDLAVRRARAAGATWEQLGQALGVSKQAVQQRYGRDQLPSLVAERGPSSGVGSRFVTVPVGEMLAPVSTGSIAKPSDAGTDSAVTTPVWPSAPPVEPQEARKADGWAQVADDPVPEPEAFDSTGRRLPLPGEYPEKCGDPGLSVPEQLRCQFPRGHRGQHGNSERGWWG